MKRINIFGRTLFCATLISPILSFVLASVIGEANIFGVAGIVRYSWIMFLFVPFGILSIIVGLKLKNGSQNYKKNIVVAFVCLPLLIVFGSYRFIFDSVSYNVEKVSVVEKQIKIQFPDEIKIATNNLDSYNLSYVKIVDNENTSVFEKEIETSQLWQNNLTSEVKSLLPSNIQYEIEVFDYFVFYNVTDDEYNKYPTKKEIEGIFVAYDCDLQRLMILDECKINLG